MISFIINLPQRIINKLLWIKHRRSVKVLEQHLNAKVDTGIGRFVIASPDLKVNLWKGLGARLVLHGNVIIRSDLGGNNLVNIAIGKDAVVEIHNEFIIGDGVKIIVSDNARLTIGGRKNESGSGITCDTKILVSQAVDIGTDFICAWHVLITDSDYHQIRGQPATLPVRIGNHVWIASAAAILKGSDIGDGSIVAAHTVVHRKSFPPDSLIAGIPAKLAKSPVEWSRDIQKTVV